MLIAVECVNDRSTRTVVVDLGLIRVAQVWGELRDELIADNEDGPHNISPQIPDPMGGMHVREEYAAWHGRSSIHRWGEFELVPDEVCVRPTGYYSFVPPNNFAAVYRDELRLRFENYGRSIISWDALQIALAELRRCSCTWKPGSGSA